MSRIIHTSNRAAHVVIDESDTWTDDTLSERVSALCGASSGGCGQSVNGMVLTDRYVDGDMCDVCLTRLKERGATIPGFMKNGELVGRSKFISKFK